jgi:hypothetical protein
MSWGQISECSEKVSSGVLVLFLENATVRTDYGLRVLPFPKWRFHMRRASLQDTTNDFLDSSSDNTLHIFPSEQL